MLKTTRGKTGNRILVATALTPRCKPGYFNLLKKSCERFGVEPFITNQQHPFTDYFWNKVTVLQRELRKIRDQFDTVIYLDGTDAFLARHPADAEEAFHALGGGILASVEVPCAPWGNRHKDALPLSPTPYRYICAGAWMAEARLLDELFLALTDVAVDLMIPGPDGRVHVEQDYVYTGRLDDQICWNELAARGWKPLKLDYRCNVFFTLQPWSETHFTLGDGYLENTVTGTRPSVLHGAGPGKPFIPRAFNAIHHGNV